MRQNAPVRKRGIVWPDRRRWEGEFAARLRDDARAKTAFKRLMREGCLWGNLMSFLYAYTFSPKTVFEKHSRRRDIALEGLKAVAGRLDRAAIAMQKILDTEWWSQPTFASFLQECRLDVQAVSRDGTVIRGESPPHFALHLPDILQSYSTDLKHLRKELQNNLSARRVGKSFYLAEFATYIEAVTQRPIPWDVLAELVNAARPETWKEKHVDASLLQKNFSNFTRRNEELYQEIRTDVGAYVATCAQLPEKERPTLVRWTLDRRTATRKPH